MAVLVEESFKGDTLTKRFLNGLKAIVDWSKGALDSLTGNGNLKDKDLLNNFFSLLNQALQSDIFPSVILHARIGAGFAAGAKLALGAKVKLYGSVAGGFVFETDVKDVLQKFISGKEAQDFMAQFNHENPTINAEVADKLEGYVQQLLNSTNKK